MPSAAPAVDVTLAGDLVTQSARLVRSMRRRTELSAGIRVLSVLDELGTATVTQLAGAYDCSQPTMSALVAGLEGEGWARRTAHPTDTRSSLVTTTRAGDAELARVRRLNGEAAADQLRRAAVTPEQLATAVAVLRALTTDLSQEGLS